MLRRILALLAILLLVSFGAVLAVGWQPIIVHLSQESGTSNSASRAYSFWSGFGSDLGEATLIAAVLGGIYGAYRKANCHTDKCWRLAHHEYDMDGAKYKLCHVCHPAVDHQNMPKRHHFAAHHKAKATSRI